jgi:hypothetical protein
LVSSRGRETLLQWLQSTCTPAFWPTVRELKEQITLILEAENVTPLSRSWWSKFVDRLINEHFRIWTAQPLEQNRYQLTPEAITKHFRQLSSLPISSYDPRLITNVDETGFEASIPLSLSSRPASPGQNRPVVSGTFQCILIGLILRFRQ